MSFRPFMLIATILLVSCASPSIKSPPFDPSIFEGTPMPQTATEAAALDNTPPAGFGVYARVVDVGPGLCVVIATRDERYMVYDAGHWTGRKCFDAAVDIIGDNSIDLMILSHSDADHLGDFRRILNEFQVRKIIRSGFRREDTATWRNANGGVGVEATKDATIINLQTSELTPGTEIELGLATVTLVAGWGEWTASGPTPSEKRNAISIVAKLTFGANSILLTGDTVGRRLTDPDDACKDAEKFMVENASDVPIESQVLVVPHHGGNNGSSDCFIKEVDPRFVVFSAGHDHEHPSAGAAERYMANGVMLEDMFRTDRHDDEGGFEWSHGAIANCQDGKGDDDIEILLPEQGEPIVRYALPDASLC